MIVHKSLIQSPNGDIILSVTEDATAIAKDNAAVKDTSDGWSQDRSRRKILSVPARLYTYWEQVAGHGCWNDRNFIKSFLMERPEYATSSNR